MPDFNLPFKVLPGARDDGKPVTRFDFQLRRDLEAIERHLRGLTAGQGIGTWDAIVDGDLTASDPENRQYKGIKEALEDLDADGFVRAWVLVRTFGVNDNSPYDDSSANIAITNLKNVWVCGQVTGAGGIQASTTPLISWRVRTIPSFQNLRLSNLIVEFRTDVSAQINATELVLETILVQQEGCPTLIIGGTYVFGTNCTFFLSRKDVNEGATMTIGTDATMAVFEGCELAWGEGLVGETLTLTLTSTGLHSFSGKVWSANVANRNLVISGPQARVSIYYDETHRLASGSSLGPRKITITTTRHYYFAYEGDSIEIDVAANATGNTQVLVDIDSPCTFKVTTNCRVWGRGRVTTLNPTSGNVHWFGSFARLDASARVVMDAECHDLSSAGTRLKLRSGCIGSHIKVSSRGDVATDGQAHDIDAGADNNFIDFANASGFPTASVNNGAGNVIRTT